MRGATIVAVIIFCACVSLSAGGGARAGKQERADSGAIPKCDVEAYVNDPDPRGTNVRSGPGSSYKVIGNLPDQQAQGITVHITGAKGDWVRIDRADEQGGETERNFFRGEGWVHASLLGVDGVGGFNGGTPLYKTPRKGRIVARLPVEGGGARIRGCRGRWTLVEYKGATVWAAPNTLCSLAITNCN